jgi:hypothetical protein
LAVSRSGNTVVVGFGNLVQLYERPSGGWAGAQQPTAFLISSDPYVFDIGFTRHGVATDDHTVVAEATKQVGNHEFQIVLVWQEPPSGWSGQLPITEAFELLSGAGVSGQNAVAVNASVIVAGDANGNTNRGAVYVWNNPPSSPFPAATLTASDGNQPDQLGFSLSLADDDTVMSGSCPLRGGSPRGAIYVFVRPSSGTWASSTETAELSDTMDGPIGLGCFIDSTGNAVASGIPSYDGDLGRIDLFAKPLSGWANSLRPTARLAYSRATGGFLGSTVHFGTTADGRAMLTSNSPYINSSDGAEDVFYEPQPGWKALADQPPSATIRLANPYHFNMNGLDAAGANMVVVANCGYADGCGNPIYVYQQRTGIDP